MGLVHGYSSSDSDSDSEGRVQETEKVSHVREKTLRDGRRRYHFTKSELKRRRLERNGTGPWSSWKSSSDKAESREDSGTGESDKDHHTENTAVAAAWADDIYNSDNEDSEDNVVVETSTFYGKPKANYPGRSFLNPPVDLDVDFKKEPLSFKCYLPKRIIYTYKGHENGTNCLKFFPKTGHMFLSGGNESVITLWDFYHDRKPVRDYRGHTAAIKSLSFSDDGKTFISSSFDKTVKIWDTETGDVTKRLRLRSFPNCVEYRPLNQEEFIVGLSDSRILHYDKRVSEKEGLVQTYDHHVGGILSVRYFPDGSKFISSSEDKTVRIWNNQINIPIKQISDTTQHTMPVINIHPSLKYFCAQSMDNFIYTYGMKPKYKRHPRKIFKGQVSAGYNIGFTFSSDGHYICSGDSKSKILIWDWNTTHLLKEINIPGKKPVTSVEWNPQETSKIICSGMSGKIYILD